MKMLPFLCLGFLTASSCSNVTSGEIRSDKQINEVAALPDVSHDCLSHDLIVKKLYEISEATGQANQAKEALLNESRRSEFCRRSLIDSIVKTMDMPASAFKDSALRFNTWRAGAELLGDLKASEALDFLVAHLDLSSGIFSTTMSQQPALRAVIDIGESAIPKLSVVLRQSPDPSMRMYSVYCISGIGGPSAVRVLKEAVASESDRCVGQFLRASIDGLNNKQQKLIDTNKWLSAFFCSS